MSEVTEAPPKIGVSRILGAEALDPIEVFWMDYGLGRGSVTITCYGSAWTSYFGGMGEKTIQEFFAMADRYYLFTKLGITPQLKQGRAHQVYLIRIIDAVKASLAGAPAGSAS
jgi:hypothetical protein